MGLASSSLRHATSSPMTWHDVALMTSCSCEFSKNDVTLMTNYDVITTFSTFLSVFRAHFFSLMATPPAKNAVDLPYGSPKEDVSADIPAITQDEIVATGCVPDNKKKKLSDEVKKVTEEAKNALEEKKETKAPPKKRKSKKKPSPAAAAAADGARYFYDIQNLIIADAGTVEKMGLGSIIPPAAPPPSPSFAAPWPTPVARQPPIQPFKFEPVTVPSPVSTVKKVTAGGNEIATHAVFCPDCGLRVEKHIKSDITEDKPGQYSIIFECPDD